MFTSRSSMAWVEPISARGAAEYPAYCSTLDSRTIHSAAARLVAVISGRKPEDGTSMGVDGGSVAGEWNHS